MKTTSKQGYRQFHLNVLGYDNSYYNERITRLEAMLKAKPRSLQINMMGIGEIPADTALLVRSVLMNRSPETQIITKARNSLQGASVLVWLLGDRRIIRDDARLFFRRANLLEDNFDKPNALWKDEDLKYCDSFSEFEPEEGDYACVLQFINEFLPVNELAGRLIGVSTLRQFGLVDNDQIDSFLATAFGKSKYALAPF